VNLARRMSNYQTYCPDGCELLHVVYTSRHVELERRIHSSLKEKRYPGTREWYKGSLKELKAVIDRLANEIDYAAPCSPWALDEPSMLGYRYRVR
jgi:hypothetical protein